jgi:hypothetical protein
VDLLFFWVSDDITVFPKIRPITKKHVANWILKEKYITFREKKIIQMISYLPSKPLFTIKIGAAIRISIMQVKYLLVESFLYSPTKTATSSVNHPIIDELSKTFFCTTFTCLLYDSNLVRH